MPSVLPPPEAADLGDYYREPFLNLLAWVRGWEASVLPPDLATYGGQFRRLSVPAQRLWVRLLLRRGPAFLGTTLAYGEVPKVEVATLELLLAGFLKLEMTPAQLPLPGLAPGASGLPRVVRRQRELATARLFFAYFGRTDQTLSDLVLDRLQRRSYACCPEGAPWPSRVAFERAFALHRAADGTWDPALAQGAAGRFRRQLFYALAYPGSRLLDEARRARALLRLARQAERAGDGALALRALGALPPGAGAGDTLRWLRRRGAREQEAWALSAQKAAQGAVRGLGEEGVAPTYDYGRGRALGGPKVAQRRLTLALPSPLKAGVAEPYALAALAPFRGWHWENRFPAWVLFMSAADVLFTPVPGAFTHPRQAGPDDLFEPQFFSRRAGALGARLEAVRQGRFTLTEAQALWHRFGGFENPLLPRLVPSSALWRASAALGAQPRRWAALLAWLVAHPGRCRRGFPDLTVLSEEGELAFYEVKAPGDQLRFEQRVWLQALATMGFQAECLVLQRATS